MDVFWIKDLKILTKKYWEVIPTGNMTRIEQLNALTRLILYYIALSFLFSSNYDFLIYTLIALILIIIVYYIYSNSEEQVYVDLINYNKNESAKYQKNIELTQSPINEIYDKYKNKNFKGQNAEIEIEAGFIDSDGNYRLGKNISSVDFQKEIQKKNNKNKKISYAENEKLKNYEARKPTIENPFMNIVFSDYLDLENIPEASNVNDVNIKETSQKLYNSSIFRSVGDVFERENSQRNFFTVPNKITPESQTNFANWLYKVGPTCKERTSSCTYFEEPYMTSQRY